MEFGEETETSLHSHSKDFSVIHVSFGPSQSKSLSCGILDHFYECSSSLYLRLDSMSVWLLRPKAHGDPENGTQSPRYHRHAKQSLKPWVKLWKRWNHLWQGDAGAIKYPESVELRKHQAKPQSNPYRRHLII